MKSRRVVLRQAAERDIGRAIDHYLGEGGADLASRFIDALEAASNYVATHPAGGSPRFAMAVDLPNLRTWPLKRFPWLIFYVERQDEIDVWRVLHAQRDIPASLQSLD